MNELSLFTGIGGGLLGTKLLGWRSVGYVEVDDYCQRVLAARIRDGYLDHAPIFGDIRAFVGEGYAASYRGLVDVVTAGFPCQPFSVAGKRLADADERNMWPATAEAIRLVGPRYVLLENSPGIASCGYLGTVLGDLAALGFDARWDALSARDCGAPHIRRRLWIVATHPDRQRCREAREFQPGSLEVLDRRGQEDSGDPVGPGLERPQGQRHGVLAPHQKRQAAERAGRAHGSPPWWSRFPGVSGMDDGLPHRVERIKATGNGQVPAVVARAWWELSQ